MSSLVGIQGGELATVGNFKIEISVIIPTRNRIDMLLRLLDSIYVSQLTPEKIELIIVDDDSDAKVEDSVLRRDIRTVFIRNQTRLLLAHSRNEGIKASSGEYLFFVDDDNVVRYDTIANLMALISTDQRIGAVVPLTYYFNEKTKLWHNLITNPVYPAIFARQYNLPISEPIGLYTFHNAFMVRKQVFQELGMFDELNFPIHLSEAEFCDRMRKSGYSILLCPKAIDWHDVPPENEKIKQIDPIRSRYLLRNRILIAKRRSVLIFLFFVFISLPMYLIYYSILYLRARNVASLRTLLQGTLEGFKG
ncbi:MAG: glycosyltransferase family 2 protein [Nitrososphaerota archaeon]|nr:glycosyltransferase family 2 protein [Nitrososphaerota archaeon]